MHFSSPGSTWRVGRGPPSHLKLWPMQYRNAWDGCFAVDRLKIGRKALAFCALGVCRVGQGMCKGSPGGIAGLSPPSPSHGGLLQFQCKQMVSYTALAGKGNLLLPTAW